MQIANASCARRGGGASGVNHKSGRGVVLRRCFARTDRTEAIPLLRPISERSLPIEGVYIEGRCGQF